jgi:hypothetical protein
LRACLLVVSSSRFLLVVSRLTAKATGNSFLELSIDFAKEQKNWKQKSYPKLGLQQVDATNRPI